MAYEVFSNNVCDATGQHAWIPALSCSLAHNAPYPDACPCRWWAHRVKGLCCSFGLCLTGSHGPKPSQLPSQVWLQRRGPSFPVPVEVLKLPFCRFIRVYSVTPSLAPPQLVRDPKVDPECIGGLTYFIWHGNASGSRGSCKFCWGEGCVEYLAQPAAPMTRPLINGWKWMDFSTMC